MEPTQRQEQPSDYARRALFGGTQALGGTMASRLLNRGVRGLDPWIRRQLEGSAADIPEEFRTGTQERVRQVLRKMVESDPHTPRNYTVIPADDVSAAAVDLSKDKRFRFSPRNTAQTIAHELGHASPKSRLGQLLQYISVKTRKPGFEALPTLMALSGVADTSEDSNVVAKAAPYLGGLMLASHLLAEGAANVRGAELLGKAGWKLPLKRRAAMFLPTATYLAKAVPLIATPVAISKGIQAYNKKRSHPSELLRLNTPTELGNLPASGEELEEKWLSEIS